jgi:hypothetical protein
MRQSGMCCLLADPQVITGSSWTDDQATRPLRVRLLLRHLLAPHTSGLGYIFVQPEVLKHFQRMECQHQAARVTMPLLFDPRIGGPWPYRPTGSAS